MANVNTTIAALIATSTVPAVKRCLADSMWQGQRALSRAAAVLGPAGVAADEAGCPVTAALVDVMALAVEHAERAERLEMDVAELLARLDGDGDGVDE